MKMLKNYFKNPFKEILEEYLLIIDIWSNKFPENKVNNLSIIEKSFMSLIIFIRSLSLVHIKDIFKKGKIRSEISEFYVLGRLFFMFYILFSSLINNLHIYILVIYFLIDGLNYRLCIFFVDRYKKDWGLRSINRTIILLMLNYFEIIIGFSIFYYLTKSIVYSDTLKIITSPIQSLYFSAITITTLGYGDMTPISSIGRILVILELGLGFILTIIIIGLVLTGVRYVKEINKY
ncbi:MAG: two pore domain potassium channel family protein [Candidatus Cloacimonetes bacterium]|nr:two pore domain potassium channel family protein [Candidatus Cloacimonadota bacterium]